MCGFVLGASLLISDHKYFAQALKSIDRRGPDSIGYCELDQPSQTFKISGSPTTETSELLLGHNRLSILDISEGGQQPKISQSGRHAIVFNGEIYNYIELRTELVKLGWQFRTESDTEVLLNSYLQWGEHCLKKLIGMFAFAIADAEHRTIFVARDYFGIKPLFFSRPRSGIIFSSEIKALLSFPSISREANAQRCLNYLRGVPYDFGEETFFKDIFQIPAATFAVFDFDGKLKVEQKYWAPEIATTFTGSFEDAAEELRNLFFESVKLHLRSDVPIGAALSGGIDSSAIVCALRHLEPEIEINAFSFISSAARNSEEKWAEIAAEKARANLIKIRPTSQELLSDLSHLIKIQDEPFGSTSIYAQYRVFKEAKEHGIKVMLDGQGADEMLAGYRSYGPQRALSLLHEGKIREYFRFARKLTQQPGNDSLKVLLKIHEPLFPQSVRKPLRAVFGNTSSPEWINRRWCSENNLRLELFNEPKPGKNFLKQWLQYSTEVTSLPNLLRYEDRNSMANSIESRVPFLNHKISEFISSLPESYILDSNATTKSVLKRAMRGIVPDTILDRRDKIGFEPPEREWLSEANPWIREVLGSSKITDLPLFDRTKLMRSLEVSHQNQRHFPELWRIINLIEWTRLLDVKF